MRLPCWKLTAGAVALFGLVLLARLKCCGLKGLPFADFLPAIFAVVASAGLPAPAALPASAGLPLPFPLPVGATAVAGLPVSAGLPASAGFPALAGPALAGLPAPVGRPASAGLPPFFPPGFETSPACAPFFSFFFCSCAPGARDASARLQIKTRNILISFFLLAC